MNYFESGERAFSYLEVGERVLIILKLETDTFVVSKMGNACSFEDNCHGGK